jgi:hypothetical protein
MDARSWRSTTCPQAPPHLSSPCHWVCCSQCPRCLPSPCVHTREPSIHYSRSPWQAERRPTRLSATTSESCPYSSLQWAACSSEPRLDLYVLARCPRDAVKQTGDCRAETSVVGVSFWPPERQWSDEHRLGRAVTGAGPARSRVRRRLRRTAGGGRGGARQVRGREKDPPSCNIIRSTPSSLPQLHNRLQQRSPCSPVRVTAAHYGYGYLGQLSQNPKNPRKSHRRPIAPRGGIPQSPPMRYAIESDRYPPQVFDSACGVRYAGWCCSWQWRQPRVPSPPGRRISPRCRRAIRTLSGGTTSYCRCDDRRHAIHIPDSLRW